MKRWAGLGVGLAILAAVGLFWADNDRAEPSPEHTRSAPEVEALQQRAQHPLVPSAARPLSPPTAEGDDQNARTAADIGRDERLARAAERERLLSNPVDVTVWPLGPDGVKGAMRELSPAIAACYQAALAEDPTLSGRFTMTFDITDVDGEGRVTKADASNIVSDDAGMEACVLETAEAMQFDAPDDGDASVSWPFVFRATTSR